MIETIELYEDTDGFFPADDEHDATHRVPCALWKKYQTAANRMVDLGEQIDAVAIKPVYVTPDQEEAIRNVVMADAWIVVREAAVLREVSSVETVSRVVEELPTLIEGVVAQVAVEPQPAKDAGEAGQEATEPTPAAAETPAASAIPEGPPRRPRLGKCTARGGLPHAALRYIITDAMSVYDPGRQRVDGLCQCGERLPDVMCPHQGQMPNVLPPTCKMCRKVLISQGGVIDNRRPQGHGGGGVDPNKPTPIPVDFGAGDDSARIRTAFRAPGD